MGIYRTIGGTGEHFSYQPHQASISSCEENHEQCLFALQEKQFLIYFGCDLFPDIPYSITSIDWKYQDLCRHWCTLYTVS